MTRLPLPSRLVWLIAAGPILLTLTLICFVIAHVLGKEVTASSFAIIFGASIAWIAIAANVWIQSFQSRREATMEMIQTTKLDATFQKNADTVYGLVPKWGHPIAPELLVRLGTAGHPEKQNIKGRKAVLFLLNFYEDIGVAVFDGTVDEGYLKRSLRGPIVSTVETLAPFIESRRSEEFSQVVWDRSANPKLWQHLIWLYDRFREDDRPPASLGPPCPPAPSASQTVLRLSPSRKK